MATLSHYELCVTTEYWSPIFSTHSDWMLDFSGGRAGTIATAYSFLFLPSAFTNVPFPLFSVSPRCNCHFVGFVMQTNVFTSYNDLFAFGCGVDCKPSILLFYLCALCVQYLHAVCGVSLCVRLNAPGGVASVLFDSLICSLLPLSLLSPVLSWLLFIVPASSPQQCQTGWYRQIPGFRGDFFSLNSSVEEEGSEEQG